MGIKACSEELHLTNATPTLTEVVNLVSLGEPTYTRTSNDSTNQTDGCIERLTPALLQISAFPFTYEYTPGDADDVLVRELMTSAAIRAFEIRVDDGTGTGGQMKVTGTGWLSSLDPSGGEVGPGGLRRSTAEFQVTGVTTVSAVP